jgi:ectoine hydroxylase-related dioxygenase (phytanoyl-CoA dioxygenase family)
VLLKVATKSPPSIKIREITHDEVEEYAEQGWATLRGLIDPDTTAELLARAKGLMGETGDSHIAREGRDIADLTSFANYYRPDKDDDYIEGVILHEQMGRNAAALLQTTNGMRMFSATLAPKLPRDMDTKNPGKGETELHQDGVRPFRSRTLAFWIALNEVTPDMGAVLFLNRSHRFGGITAPYDRWQCLDTCEWSEPLHLMPGDATVHGNDTFHRAPENASSTTRWALITAYFAANDTFNGAWTMHTDAMAKAGELTLGQQLDHPEFPLVSPARES